MENGQHLYLFTLEVAPMSVSKTYNPLPSHLTLVSRFWSPLPSNEIVKLVRPLLQATQPVKLTFGETAAIGPRQVMVHLIENTLELKSLHSRLVSLLDTINATYASPQFIGKSYKPHVSKREGVEFAVGHKQMTNAAYLIEVEISGKDHLRFIRAKFDLIP